MSQITDAILRRKNIVGTKQNPYPWVIVTNPGQENEGIFSDHATFKEARLNTINVDENDWDIMRRLDDGTLTTEF